MMKRIKLHIDFAHIKLDMITLNHQAISTHILKQVQSSTHSMQSTKKKIMAIENKFHSMKYGKTIIITWIYNLRDQNGTNK